MVKIKIREKFKCLGSVSRNILIFVITLTAWITAISFDSVVSSKVMLKIILLTYYWIQLYHFYLSLVKLTLPQNQFLNILQYKSVNLVYSKCLIKTKSLNIIKKIAYNIVTRNSDMGHQPFWTDMWH